jgi:hypothetical protein
MDHTNDNQNACVEKCVQPQPATAFGDMMWGRIEPTKKREEKRREEHVPYQNQ